MIPLMKVVMLDVPESVIAERRRKGLDRLDEVWEGVYHMAPPPSEEHQDVVDELCFLLKGYTRRHRLGSIHTIRGVRDLRSELENYRIPEWVFVRADREANIAKSGGYFDEPPDVVLEVRSPGDETDEKVPFYEKVGVREMLIVDRDTRVPEVLRLARKKYSPVSPNADGWTYCEGLRAFFRVGKKSGKPVLRVLLELDGTEHVV
ncbi:MAG: Uma2 family endonuclease [Planctomycetota bacterium]